MAPNQTQMQQQQDANGKDDKELEERKRLLRKRLQQLSECSTFNCLPNIARTKHKPVKIFWLFCFLFGVAFCTYFTLISVMEYLNYGVLSRLTVQRESVAEFPAVTFCNLNPINYYDSNATDFITRGFNKLLANESAQPQAICHKTTNMLIQSLLSKEPNQFALNNPQALFSIDDMLISCYYNQQPCTKHDFKLFYSGTYGNCYTFNSSGGYSQSPGVGNGLQLELFVGLTQNLPCWVNTNGALVAVHNRSVFPLLVQDGRKLETGVETNLVVNRQFITKLSQPYSNCVADVKSTITNTNNQFTSTMFYRETIKKLGIYVHKYCVHICAQNLSIASNISSCLMGENYTLSELRACFLTASNLDPFYAACFSQCPFECETNSLQLTPNMAYYPSESYSKELLKNMRTAADFKKRFGKPNASTLTFEEIKSSVLAVNVYYESLVYTKIEDNPAVTMGALLSNIGGTLGLFIGVSIMSFLEVFELIYEIVNIKWFFHRDIKKQKEITMNS